MGDERTLTSSSTKREPRHIRAATHTRKDVASHTVSGSKSTHSTRTSLAICVARSCSRSSCGPSARSWFSRATAPSRCCKIVMLEQHRPQPRRASARSHARGGRSGSAQSRQPAAAEAPDTHTRGGQLGLGQSGRHDYGCGAGTRARWRLTSVVGCHRVDQESTGAARAPIAPRHIFAGVHFVGGSRMRRPRSCTCGMLHCLLSGYVPRGCLDGRPDSPAAG